MSTLGLRFLVALTAALTGAGLGGCKEPAPPDSVETKQAEQPTASARQDSIAWFEGSVEEAFERARAENKSVLLYWGADWCPGCHQIKAYVFSQPEFVKKTRLLIPLYIDGDALGAQRWGEEFGVFGYPTMLLLRADRTELARMSTDIDLTAYLNIIDLALDDLRPLDVVVSELKSSATPLSPSDCKRLAYTEWWPTEGSRNEPLGPLLASAAQRCSATARVEKARLSILATQQLLREERVAIETDQPPSPVLIKLVHEQNAMLSDEGLLNALQDDFSPPTDLHLKVIEQSGAPTPEQVRARWLEILESQERDLNLPEPKRLLATRRKLVLLKKRDGTIAPPVIAQAVQSTERALASVTNPHERMLVLAAATAIFNFLGMHDRAIEVLTAALGPQPASYEYMKLLATTERTRGNPDKAMKWLERAYRETRGPATRFQAGTAYVIRLIQMAPADEERVRAAALEVLGELKGPDPLHGRTHRHLKELEAALREWNAASHHTAAIDALRKRMQQICPGISSVTGRERCSAFLSAPASG